MLAAMGYVSATPTSTGGQAIRLGLSPLRAIGASARVAERIDTERDRSGPYRDLHDLARRVRLTAAQAEALATAGAFDSLGIDRRQALWAAGVIPGVRDTHLPGSAVGSTHPLCTG